MSTLVVKRLGAGPRDWLSSGSGLFARPIHFRRLSLLHQDQSALCARAGSVWTMDRPHPAPRFPVCDAVVCDNQVTDREHHA